jgi:endonuclease G
MANDRDARLEAVTRSLNRSPEMRAAVQDALRTARFGETFIRGLPEEALIGIDDDAERLETSLPVASIEAIVRRVGRPPLVVRNDRVQLEALPDFPSGTGDKIKKVQGAVRSVGRVEFANFDMAWGGTGWVIDGKGNSRTVATNRHVAKLVAQRAADGSGVFMRNPASGVLYKMSIDFNEEVDAAPSEARPFKVDEIIYLADDTTADVALMRITGSGLPEPLPIAKSEAKKDDLVGLIGYPAYDSRNDAGDQARYFRDLFEVKRFAPGLIMQPAANDSPLMHDCTSLGGNSGSPLILLDGGGVVGLHYAGIYGKNNSAIGIGTLKALLRGERPVSVAIEQATVEVVKDGTHKPAQLANRAGFDPGFLGTGDLRTPWPKLSSTMQTDLAKPSDATSKRPFELRYTHFGVMFSSKLRQPVLTAVNIDGEHGVRIKRGRDQWFKDGRIPLADQLSRTDYDDALIDRGHMVRREDPNWDETAAPGADNGSAIAEQANLDTFHYTNAAPQHSTLNQGKQLWQGLENYILENARTRGFKACVFTGPVVRKDDPEIKKGVVAPLEFWKVVAMIDADKDELHATAYLLSQGQLIRELLEKRSKVEAVEGFVLGEYRTFQIAVRDLADATGYDFDPYADADPLAKTEAGQEAVASDVPVVVPLGSLSDIVA